VESVRSRNEHDDMILSLRNRVGLAEKFDLGDEAIAERRSISKKKSEARKKRNSWNNIRSE
jgi:hypothetical protein